MRITLRQALMVDAVFEIVVGLVFVLGSGALVGLTRWDAAGLFVVVGVGLIGAGVFLFWLANRRPIPLQPVWAVMILNAAFGVMGVVVLILLWASLTDSAKGLIGIIAAGLALIAALEYVALRSSNVR